MQPATELPTSIAGKVYEGIISVVSYFAVDYTSNWNWHLEDLGSLIPVRRFPLQAAIMHHAFTNDENYVLQTVSP
ncbi:hypothetical protein PI126_g14814 [Phytophthora idaei]|nr:hypothetical protein PI126_g14814 [Phytophthora idaei]